ncbi:MAG: PAS domain-containing sensor histidine kinase [Actinomycetota bacterium]|nr:PAS domain-containing sensor histidine kinase [Actinomycetota bacterium]
MQQAYLNDSVSETGLFQSFFGHAHTPLLVVDEKLAVIEANDAAREMLGMDLAANQRVEFLSGFWRVSATAVMRMLEGVRRQIPVVPVVARTALDRLVEVDAFLIEDHGPPMVGVIITDRSSVDDAKRRLKEEEERYRSLFEWAPVAMREEDFTAVGVWLDRLRAEGVTNLERYLELHPEEVESAIMSIRTTRVNAATVEMLKAPSILAVLRGFRHDELTPQVLEAFVAQFCTLWEGGTDYQSDFVGINFLGQPFECRLRWIVPRTNSGRDLSRVAVSLLDLTQLRSTERRLERLVADKDRFIASVSHEMRTPLSAVLGLSEELAANSDRFDEEETKELIGLVAAQSADLSLLVEDLLVAANLEAGRVSINKEILDLRTAALAAYEDCRRSHPDFQRIEIGGNLTSGFADPVRVRQIVRNLITNAIRYGGEDVSIEVGHTTGPFIRVLDNGAGVPLEHREAIFVPYFQATGTKRVLGSLGLGLAISRELARRMDGDLSYSYKDGVSAFQLDLPAV